MAKTDQTKADIAKRVGISNAAVSDWFKRDDLRLSTALRILSYYNCEIEFSLHKKEEPSAVISGVMNTINISGMGIEKKKLSSLKQAIKSSGWTMKRIAEGLGIVPETLSCYWSTDDCPISVFYRVGELIGYNTIYSINHK